MFNLQCWLKFSCLSKGRLFLQLSIVVVCLVIAACAQKPPRAIITFDYEPIPDAAPGSTNATFAIVNTRFEGPVPLFSSFAANMSSEGRATLRLRALSGRLLSEQSRAAYWDGRNNVSERVASDIYFYTLTPGDFTATRKMLIMK